MRAVWAEPRLVVEGQFQGWTADRLLRQASFKGVISKSIPSPAPLMELLLRETTIASIVD
jgi:hypothetical protein